MRWLQRNDTTFYMDEMQMRERWQYYISSFIRVEPTEGIPRSRLQKVVLTRNMPADSDEDSVPKPLAYSENLTTSICLKSSKMVWAPGTSEYFIYDQSPRTAESRERRDKLRAALSSTRQAKLLSTMVENPPWARDMNPDEVREYVDSFAKWRNEGPASAGGGGEGGAD